MLLRPSDKDLPGRAELPLDTPEQIERARTVDDVRERRARIRQEENKAEAGEIANETARFALSRNRIMFTIALLLLPLSIGAVVGLWLIGERLGALYLLAGGGGIGSARAWVRAGQKN